MFFVHKCGLTVSGFSTSDHDVKNYTPKLLKIARFHLIGFKIFNDALWISRTVISPWFRKHSRSDALKRLTVLLNNKKKNKKIIKKSTFVVEFGFHRRFYLMITELAHNCFSESNGLARPKRSRYSPPSNKLNPRAFFFVYNFCFPTTLIDSRCFTGFRETKARPAAINRSSKKLCILQ